MISSKIEKIRNKSNQPILIISSDAEIKNFLVQENAKKVIFKNKHFLNLADKLISAVANIVDESNPKLATKIRVKIIKRSRFQKSKVSNFRTFNKNHKTKKIT